MKIWGLSDTHFPGSSKRQMIFFGKTWHHHVDEIVNNWRETVDHDDIVLICGDITWSNNLKNALKDIRKLSELPGKYKILVKGNHDYWWNNHQQVCTEFPDNMKSLESSAIKLNGHVFCGTEGWVSPNDSCFDNLDQKFFEREMALLEKTLEAAIKLKPEKGLHLLLHFPPFTSEGVETPFYKLLIQYPLTSCTYGHFHLKKEWDRIPKGLINGITFNLTSTDYLNNRPALIWEDIGK